MKINLRPHSGAAPLEIEEEQYHLLVKKKEHGWSECAEETEWLAKLHYLRSGYHLGKVDATQFDERELRLVQGWLKKMAR